MVKNSGNTNASPTQAQEIADIRKRLDWLDEERRKSARLLAELEQRGELRAEDVPDRVRRIKDLEQQVAALGAQVKQATKVDDQLAQFKKEIISLVEKLEERRTRSATDLEKMRRVDHEAALHEINDLRSDIAIISQLEQGLQLQQAEDTRLITLIGTLESSASRHRSEIETAERAISFLEEKEKQSNRNAAEVQTAVLDLRKQLDRIQARLEVLVENDVKSRTRADKIDEAQSMLADSVKEWSEQVQIGEHERNRRLSAWQRTMDEHDVSLARFAEEWVKFNDQIKESRAVLKNMESLGEQLTKKQNEAMEKVRVETQRLEARWEKFLQEDTRKWKNFEADFTQRQAVTDRRSLGFDEQFDGLRESLTALQVDRDRLLRIQTAQAEAIKKWPLLWIEEIEKAAEQDPNRRRQPTLSQVREE